ncbi:hypothetical protein ACKFKG_01275 [Phormidesmis sp. 146-35]
MNLRRTSFVFAGVFLATSSSIFFGSKPSISANPSYSNAVHTSVEPSQKGILLAQNFPLRGKQFDELSDHRRMDTSITISNNGRIDGVTRTWTAHKYKGYTGSVVVTITDRAGNILHVTKPEVYGVNCRRCPGPSDRTVQWAQAMPANLVSQVGGYAIFHAPSHRPRFLDWFRDGSEAAKRVGEAYKSFN